jgi:hypothetical protein
LGAFRLNFVAMETMTITVKTKKAKRIIEELVTLNEVRIEPSKKNRIKEIENIKGNQSIDVSWVPENQQAHAKEILSAYKKGKQALEKNIPLKSAKDFLNEL